MFATATAAIATVVLSILLLLLLLLLFMYESAKNPSELSELDIACLLIISLCVILDNVSPICFCIGVAPVCFCDGVVVKLFHPSVSTDGNLVFDCLFPHLNRTRL